FEGDEEEEQPLFRRREGAVLGHRQPAGRPWCPSEAPRRQWRVARRREGQEQRWKLREGHAGHIQERRGAARHVGASSTGHPGGLLSWEAPSTINHGKLS